MIKLNCLAKTLENAKDIYLATKKNALIGILTKDFDDIDKCKKIIEDWAKELDGNISIGLGGGDPKQAYTVTKIAGLVNVNHINQVFTEVPATRNNSKNKNAIINSLVSPSGTPGKVIISTGPISSLQDEKVLAPVRTVAAMIKEMGGNSIKYFNMKNMKSIEEYIEVAKACAEYNLIMEMTGGLSLDNIEQYIKIAKEVGVKDVIPHVYGSIIDPKTGLTDIKKVKELWKIFKDYY